MAIVKRKVFPHGKNTAADLVEEFYDDEKHRVVPKPENWKEPGEEKAAAPAAAPAEPPAQ